jgi:hypothetical protein
MTESSPPNLGTPKPGSTNVAQPETPALDTTDDVRDELPHDLDPSGFVGPYQFPDNSRRRWPGVIYLVIAAACVGVYFGFPDSPIVNVGWLVAAGLLTAAAVISITSGWRMHVDETEALVAAQGAVGFAIGHASAQQVWRGLRSRPTWRVLCYSAEDPPVQRGLVLVDAIDGEVVQHLVEPNPDIDVLL